MKCLMAINVLPRDCFSLAPHSAGDRLVVWLMLVPLFISGCVYIFKAVKERKQKQKRKQNRTRS